MEKRNPSSLPVDYVRAGLALIPIPRGMKSPQITGWQLEDNAIRSEEAAASISSGNFGLAHRWCRTCAVDIDDYSKASEWLAMHGIDTEALLLAEDAVQIKSGRPNRAKLLYRLPEEVEWLPTFKPDQVGLELRCASRDGTTTVQDVLPPSIHPETGKPYEWAGSGDWRHLPILPSSMLNLWQSLSIPRAAQPKVELAPQSSHEIAEGGRNEHLTKLAGALRRKGMELPTIEAALLAENANKCRPPLPETEVRGVAKSIMRYAPSQDSRELVKRCAPEPLRRPVPPPHPYPLDELGGLLKPAAEAIRRVIQAPEAIIGGSLLAAASLATQALADVHLDGRVYCLSLWFLNVAESGERKSAVDNEVMRAAREHERAMSRSYEDELLTHDAEIMEWNARREQAKKDATKSKGRGLAESIVDLGAQPLAPLIPRLTAADFTAEGLFKLLQAGYPSIGAFTDEAAQVFGGHGMQKETVMRTAGALCRLWDNGELDRVRSGDGAQKLYGRRFAMHLLAQPVIAERAFSDGILSDQGFLPRCLIAWPAGTAGTRSYCAESLRDDVSMRLLFDTLLSRHRHPMRFQEGQRQALEPRILTLTPEANAHWRALEAMVEASMAPGKPFASVKAWASKTSAQVIRIAGVLTLVENAEAKQIDGPTMARASELGLWHLNEAFRLKGMAEVSPEVLDAEALLQWCHETGRVHLYSTVALNRGPTRIREGGKFRAAMKVLEVSGWAHATDGPMTLDGKLRRSVWQIVPAGEGR